jgi:hypothetical protein
MTPTTALEKLTTLLTVDSLHPTESESTLVSQPGSTKGKVRTIYIKTKFNWTLIDAESDQDSNDSNKVPTSLTERKVVCM